MKFFRNTLGPLFLLIAAPIVAIIFWYAAVFQNGSFLSFHSFPKIWASVFWGSKTAWSMLFIYAAFEILLLKIVPGKPFSGPETATTFTPRYKENGPLCFLITIATYCILSFGFKLFSPAIIYYHLGELISASCLFSLAFCLFLYFKGRFFPSSKDTVISGNFIFDYYMGTELYPHIFGVNVKQFTNCRFGMMAWPIILISYAAAQSELYGLANSMLISILLQCIYVTKFFFWEKGYLRSIDIMHDRAGFMICWGCLVWLPIIYTSPSLYLVHHPIHFSIPVALAIFTLGFASIMVNYWADRQRTSFREKKGNLTIWGAKPALTRVHYTATTGEQKENLLLASGFWGISRHFHYVPELLGAFFWSLPALFNHFYPYFYFCFLTILLFDRASRDDRRCSAKYGEGWKEHCKKVRYKIIPFVY